MGAIDERERITMMTVKELGTTATGATLAEVSIADLQSAELPTIQAVRGVVWPMEQRAQLVLDYKAGKYVPPVTLVKAVGEDDETVYSLIDGQQRMTTLVDAMEKELIDPESPVLCMVIDGDPSTYFHRLNVGVPVGKAIVSSVNLGSAGETVLKLAQHPIWSKIGLSNLQKQRGGHADMSLAILAICGGWAEVESTSKAAIVYVKENKEACEAAYDKAYDLLTDLDSACVPYRDYISKHGKSNKATVTARRVLSDLRKKNLLYTVVDGIVNGAIDPSHALAALTFRDRLEEPLRYTYEVNGKERKAVAKWTVGGGSSGSNTDFVQRQRVFANVAAGLSAADLMNGLTEEAKAEPVASEVDAAAVAALIGGM